MIRVFVLNIKRENWSYCVRNKIFAVKVGAPTPAMDVADILLARMLKDGTDEYGVKGLWFFRSYEAVTPKTYVPWTDGQYSTILHFEPLVLQFSSIFSEDFSGWESKKIKGLAQVRLNASVISLKPNETRDYLQGILLEMHRELDVIVNYNGRNVNLKSLLQEILSEIVASPSTVRPKILTSMARPKPIMREGEIVGSRIDSPILNYAPLNELGVVVLFGFYMQELGFSHLEQIRTQFPDAIGMQRLPDGRLQRVRLEFEYESKNFEQHGHDPKQCDIVICWAHNWKNCPPNLQVIELKSFIEESLKG
jgi:hypothetical protein